MPDPFPRLVACLAAVLIAATGSRAAEASPPPSPATAPAPEPAAAPQQEPGPVTETPGAAAGGGPWVLADDIRARLARDAEIYKDYALRFSCGETVRTAHYDDHGEASKEDVRKYAYLLEREADGVELREFRQKTTAEGTPKGAGVKDEEPFPPAYAWVFLFSSFNQPYFGYRDLGDRFDGFDWVREIQFRGALPFTDGKDIRQWEGTVLVDAVTFSPLEIQAQPSGQDQRVKALFARWNQAFNLMGAHLAPRPFLYRCHVEFRFRKDGLSFPTELRYDTLRAVSSKETVHWLASSRRYDGYKFFKTAATEGPGKPVPNK